MMTGKPIRVALLGPLEVRDLSGGLVELSGARLRALVVRLALSPRRNVGRETLIDDLWGAELPSNPLNAVQALVSRVRRAAPDLPVLSGPAGYQLAVERDDIDLWCFEALVRRGRAELEDRPERAAVEQLRGAGGGQLRRGVLVGVLAQLGQAALVHVQGLLALGQGLGDFIFLVLRAAQQRVQATGRAHAGFSLSTSCCRALRLWDRSAEACTSWPRHSMISGQRSRASSVTGSLPRWYAPMAIWSRLAE